MAVTTVSVEIFQNYIIEKLRRSNPHLAFASDESAKVLGGAVVHIPQAGASPSVKKNRGTFPATAVKRADSFVTYSLDVYTTDPTHIEWAEENEISYDKMDSVLNDHTNTLMETVGDNMLYNWVNGLDSSGKAVAFPAKNIIRTTGAAIAATESGQTGNRKAFTYKELQKAQAMMDKMNVPKMGRVALLESYMYQQFLDSLSANQMAAFSNTADLANGVVGKFAGFTILERSTVLMFTSANKVQVPGTAVGETDNIGALCWQKDCVAKATGDIKPFLNSDDATYYGNVFSAEVKCGGRAKRAGYEGIVAIVQDTAA